MAEIFEIKLEIQEPTSIQKNQEKYLMRHKIVTQTANYYKIALLKILNNKIDFTSLNEKKVLIIRYKRTGKYKIEYNSIQNKNVRFHVRNTIEKSRP